MANRLLKEYREVLRNRARDEESGSKPEIALFPPDESNLYSWHAYIRGPPDTPYSDHYFALRFTVPRTYPLSPPKVVFSTRVCHPNVHPKSGDICLDVLKDAWTPIWTLESTCRAIIALLAAPDADSPLNCDAGNLIRAGDMLGFESLARMYTIEYGMKQMPALPRPQQAL